MAVKPKKTEPGSLRRRLLRKQGMKLMITKEFMVVAVTGIEVDLPPKVERPELIFSSRNILNQTNEDFKSTEDQTRIPAVQI